MQFLFPIVIDGAIGDFQNTFAQKAYGVIVHLVIGADETLSHSLIDKFQNRSLPVFRAPGKHAQGDIFANCGSLIE